MKILPTGCQTAGNKAQYMSWVECGGLEVQGKRLSASFNHGEIMGGLSQGQTEKVEIGHQKYESDQRMQDGLEEVHLIHGPLK